MLTEKYFRSFSIVTKALTAVRFLNNWEKIKEKILAVISNEIIEDKKSTLKEFFITSLMYIFHNRN